MALRADNDKVRGDNHNVTTVAGHCDEPAYPNPLLIDEILEVVFNIIARPDLGSCRLVCWTWHNSATPFFKRISQFNYVGSKEEQDKLKCLTDMERPVPFSKVLLCRDELMNAFLEKQGHYLSSLSLRSGGHHGREGLVKLGLVTDLDFSAFMKKVLFHWCPNLEELEIEDEETVFRLEEGKPLHNLRKYAGSLTMHEGVADLLKAAGNNLRHITLNSRGDEVTKGLGGAVSLSLSSLRSISCKGNLGQEDVVALYTGPFALQLEQLEFGVKLKLSSSGCTNVLVSQLLSHMPNLQTASINVFISAKSKGKMTGRIRFRLEPEVGIQCDKLLCLKLCFTQGKAEIEDNFEFVLSLPNLRMLELEEKGVPNSQGPSLLRNIFASSRQLSAQPHTRLTSLRLGVMPSHYVKQLKDLSKKYFPNLVKLFINVLESSEGSKCIVEEVLTVLAKSSSGRLKELRIEMPSHSSNTCEGFKCPRINGLQRLEIVKTGSMASTSSSSTTASPPCPLDDLRRKLPHLSCVYLSGFELGDESLSNIWKERTDGIPFVTMG